MTISGIMMILVLAIAGCATDRNAIVSSGKSCDAPIWEEGDTWQYAWPENKVSETRVKSRETFNKEDIYVLENRGGNNNVGVSVKTLGERVDINKQTGQKHKPILTTPWEYDFPLYVGKKWGRTITGTSAGGLVNVNYFVTSRVVGFEEITVLAGTFETFKIEIDQKAMDIGSSVVVYVWYAPQVKNYIKVKYGGATGRWTINAPDIELRAYKVKTPGGFAAGKEEGAKAGSPSITK
jgi:hypothetical protein